MELNTDIKTMDNILDKAERIAVLSDIIRSFNFSEEKSPDSEKFIDHLSETIADIAHDIISISQKVSIDGILMAHSAKVEQV